ncbi:MAG: glycosyltransferase family 2 protein [Pseudanabaenaceae cyanobacterium bins.68]|nr:glycosyltransferase family 2 protein [Pseudanabaenaceae cyanobacterium bins.68]
MYLLTVNYFSRAWVEQLWQSVDQAQAVLVVVNNAPLDQEIISWVAEQGSGVVLLQAGTNLGFGRGCNLGLTWIYDRDRDAVVWLLNPDARLLPEAIATLSQILSSHPHISILGTVILEPGGKVSFGGGGFNPKSGEILELQRLPTQITETAWLSGCSLVLNLAKFATCPEFSPDYFLYYEDFDFCRRYAQAGHQIWLTPELRVIHQGSAIARQYPLLKLRHQIYGYLISLQKYGAAGVAGWRSGRIFLAAIAQLPISPGRSLGKLWGLGMFWRFKTRTY